MISIDVLVIEGFLLICKSRNRISNSFTDGHFLVQGHKEETLCDDI